MTARPFQIRYEHLPVVLPVFPLAGSLLLPDGRLPLNVFEPRYLAMVEDALGAKRLIGMIQPNETAPRAASVEPPLYETGCAGRVAQFAETGDGRLLITLAGVCRFKVAREIDGVRGYRRVAADWAPFRTDLEPPPADFKIDRTKLLAALRTYLALNEIKVDWGAIEGTPDAALAIVLPMSCPFEAREKQAMLECPTQDERVALLIALMEMAVAEGKGGGGMVKQ